MDITALLSQRVASVSSVPAGDSAGDFANVLQSVATRSAAAQPAPLGQQSASIPPALADNGRAGSRMPLQFTIAELQNLPPALATRTGVAEPIAGDTASGDNEPVATVTDLAPEAASSTHPGTILQAAATIKAEPVEQGLATMNGGQPAIQPGSSAEVAATGPASLPNAAVVAAATAAPAPAAMPGDRTQVPAARTTNGILAEVRPGPAALAAATATLTPTPSQAMDASLAATNPAVSAGSAPGSGIPLPEVDWSRNSAAEPQRGLAEPVGSAAPAGPALTGTGSTPQPAMSSLLQASLSAPVASPAWQQQLGSQLTGLAQRGRQQIELHLNPADLGPLSVSLKVDDHGAQAQFLSAHATVRAAVEQAIPQLREALAEQGIALGETSVGEQQRHGNEQSGSDQGPPVSTTAAAGSGNPVDGAADAVTTSLPGDLSGVDIYA